MLPEPIDLPESAIEERFLAATGPGGQNVNKVAVAAQLRLDTRALGLAPEVMARLVRLAGSRMGADGAITVTARRFRTREANRADARERLGRLVAAALVAPVRRRPTKPSKAARQRRADSKTQRGVVKRGRARPDID
jgi:ribosome-associated protein